MRPRFKQPARLAALTLLACACAGDPPTAPGTEAPELLERLPRALTAGEIHVADASNEFAFDLLRGIAADEPGENIFISPLSISMALGMTMNGAAGETYDEMRHALRFGDLPTADINASYRSLLDLLRGLDPTTELLLANSIWYDRTFPFRATFFSTARDWFDAEITGLDFLDPDAPDVINDWVRRATKEKITKVIDEIEPQMVMFLLNAIYFNGSWRNGFAPAATATAAFHAPSGPRQVPLMYQEHTLPYAAGSDYQAVELPYGNGAFVMTVVLPAPESDIATFAATLTADGWEAMAESLRSARVELHLPRFTLRYERKLNNDLWGLGMQRAFIRGGADFTPMSPEGERLYIDFVRHDSYVDVHEKGTEAAAVTTVGVGVVCACEPPRVEMRVDRPFLFAIRERHSGTILFLGAITDPG